MLTVTAAATTSVACNLIGHCNTYKLLACSSHQDCFCGLDTNSQPTCFENTVCEGTKSCSSDDDCSSNEACGVGDCCGHGSGRCFKLATGCIDGIAATEPYWKPTLEICGRMIDNAAETAGITHHNISTKAKRLAC
jgi:hypothetical protein